MSNSENLGICLLTNMGRSHFFSIGPLQLGSRDQIFPKKFLYYGL